MDEWHLATPVAFIIFNRPDTTARVFAEIAKVKPPKLLVVADGPRPSRSKEEDKCAAARAVIEQVDWDCELITNYSDINIGCRQRVSSGLDWIFKTVEEAIILEDDCLPHPTFFRFCDELLDKYRDDERIMAISGNNFQAGRKRTHYSYYFSRYNHLWGWATWRRAWHYYDVDMTLWPEIKAQNRLKDILEDSNAVKYWLDKFQMIYDGRERQADTWDYQWTFACWLQSGLTILPNVNLVSNIGFSPDATHTLNKWSRAANLPVGAINFPLKHPPYMVRNAQADAFTHNVLFKSNILTRNIKRIVKKFLMDHQCL